MTFPEDVLYTKDHEWVRVSGDTGIVGITDYAQGELGDVVFVELPAVGTALTAGKMFGTIEAVKAVSDLYAPVTGEVLEINSVLEKSPETVNKEPYAGGWMVKVKIANPAELKNLLDPKKYRELIGK